MSIHKLNRAMDLMRKTGAPLIQINYHGKPEYWIPPGTRIEPAIAEQIIGHEQVVGSKDALFPGHHQTWKVRSGDDRAA